jgi:hypothetical protein
MSVGLFGATVRFTTLSSKSASECDGALFPRMLRPEKLLAIALIVARQSDPHYPM